MRNVPHQMILQLTFTLFFIPPSLPPNSVKTSAETLTNHPFVSVKVAPIRREPHLKTSSFTEGLFLLHSWTRVSGIIKLWKFKGDHHEK